jgi:ABC-type multidrug transport system fused ATPase/permease subunit
MDRSRRRQLLYLLALVVITSLAEIASLSSILPFLAALTNPENFANNTVINIFAIDLGNPSQSAPLFSLTLAFIAAALLAGGLRVLLLWSNTHLSFLIGTELGFDMYRKTLFQPYHIHISRNSSEIISAISTKRSIVIYNVLLPLLNLTSAAVILVGLVITLVYINPLVALSTLFIFSLIYILIAKVTQKKITRFGAISAQEDIKLIQSLQEGLGGIRDILIDRSQLTFLNIYRASDEPMRKAQGLTTFYAGSPRYVVECLGMIAMAVIGYAMATHSSDMLDTIPILGVLALASQRMLPLLQQTYSSLMLIRSSHSALLDVLALLNQPLTPEKAYTKGSQLPFSNRIELRNITYRYNENTPNILVNLNLIIPKSSRIGIIGSSGSGKTTLTDLLLGLLSPTSGQILIDNTVIGADNINQWQSQLAHVPQDIYLMDASIARNIAFGVPAELIDLDRVKTVAEQIKIAQLIESWADGYETRVGERGTQLSGGQRQRIGIARALYKKANLIVLDEATSALDYQTEQSVMNAINDLSSDLTILIIAHRLETLRECDQIIEISGGSICRIGTYSEVTGAIRSSNNEN